MKSNTLIKTGVVFFVFLFGMQVKAFQKKSKKAKKPNLIIIHTDEHNFRTLGCYRDLMSKEQAYMWGEGIEVKTPNLDRIAREGAICTSFYAASPVCSPSRSSFVSGTYPIETGVVKNGDILDDDVITFAEVLKQQGYATSYVGKWHLEAGKDGERPKKKFGFDNNEYTITRGHYKQIVEKDGTLEWFKTNKSRLDMTNTESFATDFLISKTLEVIKKDKDKPFCHMVSLPDPHGPNKVRPPYDTMYDDFVFQSPRTMGIAKEKRPKWSFGKNQTDKIDQNGMQDYFGMVKCIDDNVGRILKFLDDEGLADNTVIVFTSDHGDLCGEHNKNNKSSPYEASAKIPFIIRYPNGIKPGKVINTAFTTVDFAPTVLGLMGANKIPGAQGLDASKDFLNKNKNVDSDRITYVTTAHSAWTASISDRYKYVMSDVDEPWLFDMEVDPDELINFNKDPKYADISAKFSKELVDQMNYYKDPAIEEWKKEKSDKGKDFNKKGK